VRGLGLLENGSVRKMVPSLLLVFFSRILILVSGSDTLTGFIRSNIKFIPNTATPKL
jgi:hypothetical protein